MPDEQSGACPAEHMAVALALAAALIFEGTDDL